MGAGRAVTDFGDTFQFVEGAGVFDVPDGVTVNSPRGNIVDNRVVPTIRTAALT